MPAGEGRVQVYHANSEPPHGCEHVHIRRAAARRPCSCGHSEKPARTSGSSDRTAPGRSAKRFTIRAPCALV